ncbi:FHA domain-containing protein [Streptomyces niveus]|uniref:FHA domain-containing protein n=1 Tax=Streptomyces niveus TaxID=193462 RepID=UPI00365BF1C1
MGKAHDIAYGSGDGNSSGSTVYSVIVVPIDSSDPGGQVRLAPGETLRFGRATADGRPGFLTIAHHGVSRRAGEITAVGSHWTLSNLSRTSTYVVENPEGAGEHIKIAPGRIEAPIPFEFSRVVLPAAGDLLSFDIWAPRHDYADETATARDGDEGGDGCGDGEPTVHAFPLDRSKRYFLVLAALCEARLRGAPHAPLPTVDQVVDRLRPLWPTASRTAVQWNIDYLAVKFRMKQPPESAACGPRLNGKKESLVSLALRFDLVREAELAVLTAAPAAVLPGAAAP